MGKIRKIKAIDVVMASIILIKSLLFYMITSHRQINLGILFVTFVFLVLIVMAFSISTKQRSIYAFGIVYGLISLVMFADSMYYAYFNQLPSIIQLLQVKSLMVIDADTFKVSIPPLSLLLLADIPFTIYYYGKLNKRVCGWVTDQTKKRIRRVSLAVLVFALVSVINPLNADAIKIVNQSEVLTYHLRDLYEQVIEPNGDYIQNQTDLDQFMTELAAEKTDDYGEYIKLHNRYNNYNLIVIQLESFQNFVINKSFEGEPLTPNLNRLIQDKAIYFDHYYQTIGRGNTSDAEFGSNNSLYPSIEGECYRLYEQNNYNGLMWRLKERNYSSKVYHGYLSEFWNRSAAYPQQGMDDFISLEDFEFDDKISFGLSDKSFYNQTFDKIMEEYSHNPDKPFHKLLISLSCHYPYYMPEEYKMGAIEDKEHQDALFTNYLSAIKYSDQALGEFLDRFYQSPLKDNTIVVMYGDHHGLNCLNEENNLLVSRFLGKPYDYDTMLNIPLVMLLPNLENIGIEQRTCHKVGGQVDLLPTLSYLMGFQTDEYVMGNNLFEQRPGYVASVSYMLKGSFVKDGIIYQASPTEIFEEGRAWRPETGEPIEDLAQLEELRPDFVRAKKLLEASKYILDYNLITR